VLAAIVAKVALRERMRPRWPKGGWAALGALALASAAWLFVVVHFKQGHPSADFRGLGDPPFASHLSQFVSIPAKSFEGPPYEKWPCAVFWEVLFRTSLFGEFSSGDPHTEVFAYAALFLALVFLPFLLAGFAECAVRALRPYDHGCRELLILLLGFIGFVAAFRFRHPYPSHNDFRFALPVLPACAIMTAMALGRVRRRLAHRFPHVAALPGWLVVAFCLNSARLLLAWS
jgi:hypothetical protein